MYYAFFFSCFCFVIFVFVCCLCFAVFVVFSHIKLYFTISFRSTAQKRLKEKSKTRPKQNFRDLDIGSINLKVLEKLPALEMDVQPFTNYLTLCYQLCYQAN